MKRLSTSPSCRSIGTSELSSARVLRSRAELLQALSDAARPLGLVPTMGWLHGGHRELMRRSREESATSLVSIFVNPRQFNETSDYSQYPRNEERDIAICSEEGADLVFVPSVDEVYPAGFDTKVVVGEVALPLEGAARPGHFEGVATVVAILFNLVGAERAYFGQKDAQQVMVIRRMALDLAMPTQVIACPTVREADGLALSSRNVHLSEQERAAAPVIYRALVAARERWSAGERSAEVLRQLMRDTLAREPLAEVEYVSVADGRTLHELQQLDGPALLSLAVRFGATRLIDNVPLDGPAGAGQSQPA